MLTLKKLSIEDFGPYREAQTIEFPSPQGVYIVYGPNGRGKTTLHNAFRYALYGENLSRTRVRSAIDTANTESAKARGHASFKTVLEFDNDGAAYVLTRRFDATALPSETMFLERDGVPLTQVAAAELLNSMAPKSVSQFFLFDGERLKEYEDLLETDSQDGEALEIAIERVLGIPVVANALADMKSILQRAGRLVAERYVANAATEKMGLSLKEAQALRDEFESSRASIEERVSVAQERVGELEEQLKNQEKSQRLLSNLDLLRAQRSKLEQREKVAIASLADVSDNLWKAVLSGKVAGQVDSQQAALLQAQTDVVTATAAARDLDHLNHGSDCPTCQRDLDAELRARIVSRTSGLASEEHQAEVHSILEKARERLGAIDQLRRNDAQLIADRDRAVRSARLDLRTNADDIDDIDEQLTNIDEVELRGIATERDERTTQIARDRERLSDTAQRINDQDVVIADLLRKLSTASVKLDDGIELKQEVSASLTALFTRAIDAYRAELREAVETNASEVFRALSTEKDYVDLRITDKYGLEIVDSGGEIVKGRSAGYEHLVALALITALQDSAAVRGPVIMDSPFGRLDPENTSNVVAALPRMARQVVLLAFDGEFDREAAMQALGSSLIAEFTLERVSARNTRIDRRI